jgi:hypothetical protein
LDAHDSVFVAGEEHFVGIRVILLDPVHNIVATIQQSNRGSQTCAERQAQCVSLAFVASSIVDLIPFLIQQTGHGAVRAVACQAH